MQRRNRSALRIAAISCGLFAVALGVAASPGLLDRARIDAALCSGLLGLSLILAAVEEGGGARVWALGDWRRAIAAIAFLIGGEILLSSLLGLIAPVRVPRIDRSEPLAALIYCLLAVWFAFFAPSAKRPSLGRVPALASLGLALLSGPLGLLFHGAPIAPWSAFTLIALCLGSLCLGLDRDLAARASSASPEEASIDRARVEEKLEALNERLAIATRAAKLGIWDWDLAEDRLEWDDRMHELYGIGEGDFGGMVETWQARLHPEDYQRSVDEMNQALRGEKPYDTTFRILLGDGSLRFIRAFAQVTRDATGAAVRMTGVNFDITETRVTEEELRRKNELLRQTGELAKVGSWEFDSITGEGSWSEEVARIHDLEPKATTNVKFGLDFYTEESRPVIAAAVKAAVESAEPFDLVLNLISAKGARKWVHTLGVPILEGGKVVRVRGIFQDITEQKRSEHVLHASESMMRLFVENSPAAIAMFDREMRYLLASRRWLESYHLADQDLLGKCHYDVFPEIGQDWKAVHRRCLAGAVESREEDAFPRADGSLDWVRWEVRPWFGAEGEIGGLIIFSEVITERKNAELKASISEERYRNLFENMVEGFAFCKMDFVGGRPVDWSYLAVNPAFERLTGLVGVAGKKVSEAIPGILESDPQLFEIYGRVALGGGPERFEMDVKSLDLWFSISAYSPEKDHFVAVFDVITERKRAEAEVKTLNEELERRVRQRTAELQAANSELESFAYSVSHDLRSPLRGIDGYVSILLEEETPRLSEAGRVSLGKVREGARQMGRLIDDLLELARVGRAELGRGRIDMGELAKSVADEFLPPGRLPPVTLALRPLLPAYGDLTLIKQVWRNLISNAVKFSSKRERPAVEIACEKEGSVIRYSVRDNGAGFDMRYRSKLFGLFQRLHGSREFEGTGVGLAIVQRIVERHGGSVDAVGAVGEGATISFTLPDTE